MRIFVLSVINPFPARSPAMLQFAPPPRQRTPRPGLWSIRGPMSQRQYWLFAFIGLVVPLAAWWILSSQGWVSKVFMPGPVDVWHRTATWWTQDRLLNDTFISIYRVTVGWLLSAVIAVPLGILIGTFRPVQALLEPLTDFIRYMPAVAFIPLVMLWIGIDESSKIAIIFIGTFFQMVLMVAEDVRRVPTAQIEAAQTMGATRSEIIDLGMRHRGPHDELLRAFHSGQQFKFDILMDVGGFRDMHRHRRCTQIEQGFTRAHGYDTPPDVVAAGLEPRYKAAMQRVCQTCEQMSGSADPHAGLYLLPMAFRKRTLFKMDFAETLYIAELRSGPAGHFSYRNVAYAMYEEIARKHPGLARYFRVTDVKEPVDLLKR